MAKMNDHAGQACFPKEDYAARLSDFIERNPCNFMVVAAQAQALDQAGYQRLREQDAWDIKPGGAYYVVRNGSSLAAFRIPSEQTASQAAENPPSFLLMASHSDSPTFRVKVNPEITTAQAYTTLNVEQYGGGILASWFDRPLSVAGRLMVKTPDGVRAVNVNVNHDLLLIPRLAIHMNRDANKETPLTLNVQKELLPLYGGGSPTAFLETVAQAAGVQAEHIVSHELSLYARMKPSRWGADQEFLSAPRLDDVLCAYASLQGFLEAQAAFAHDEQECFIPVHVLFDNEEVGSGTKQGAAGTFLKDVLERIAEAWGLSSSQYRRALAKSFMLSADNGHALHPNYPEKCDPTNKPTMGGGVLLKHAANQKYTTDAVSEALVCQLAQQAGVPLQHFVNRSDTPGGSTLGNLSSAQVSVCTADVGIAQLAMHSSYETCAAADVANLVALARQLFGGSVLSAVRSALI